MRVVRDILKEKGTEVYSISPDDTVYRFLQTIAERNVGALVVIEDGAVVGVIAERDYARKVILKGRFSRDVPVREIMTPRSAMISVGPEHDIEACMELITENRVRHLPVFDEDRLVGMVSIGDIVKAIIEHKEEIIDQLENYIRGKR